MSETVSRFEKRFVLSFSRASFIWLAFSIATLFHRFAAFEILEFSGSGTRPKSHTEIAELVSFCALCLCTVSECGMLASYGRDERYKKSHVWMKTVGCVRAKRMTNTDDSNSIVFVSSVSSIIIPFASVFRTNLRHLLHFEMNNKLIWQRLLWFWWAKPIWNPFVWFVFCWLLSVPKTKLNEQAKTLGRQSKLMSTIQRVGMTTPKYENEKKKKKTCSNASLIHFDTLRAIIATWQLNEQTHFLIFHWIKVHASTSNTNKMGKKGERTNALRLNKIFIVFCSRSHAYEFSCEMTKKSE